MQRKVQNTPRKRNKTCSNLMQATQELANDMAGICHVISRIRRVHCGKSCISCVA